MLNSFEGVRFLDEHCSAFLRWAPIQRSYLPLIEVANGEVDYAILSTRTRAGPHSLVNRIGPRLPMF
jgi:hypothetical protein